jgi:hypothetical protein
MSVVGNCRLERSASEGPSGLRIKTFPIAQVRRLGRGWKNPSRTDNAFDGVPRRPAGLSRPQRVSVTGAGEDVSDCEGVVATFFLIRYQTAVASSTDINFARQFSRVSLARRTESNFARQFFEVSLFIIAVRQNFRDALTKRLRSEIALNSPPMANGNAARLFGGKLPPRRPIAR